MLSHLKISLSTIICTVALALLVSSCSDSSTGPDGEESQLKTHKVKDIPANPKDGGGGPPGAPTNFTYFDLAKQEKVSKKDSASAKWDIAFSGTTIIVNNAPSGPGNGGAVVLDQSFEATTTAPSSGFKTDSDSAYAISGWYTYTGNSKPKHAILPKEDKTIVVRTADGNHYAKISIVSYYEGNPDTSTDKFADSKTRPASRYYTFKYTIQLNGSRKFTK